MVKFVIKEKWIYASFRNDDGFTYMEALVGLSILSVLVLLLPGILSFFNNVSLPEDDFDGDMFIIEVLTVADDAQNIEYDSRSDSLTFTTSKGDIKFRHHNERIVKSIDDKGFVTVMFGVETFKVSEMNDGYRLSVETKGEFNEAIYFTDR